MASTAAPDNPSSAGLELAHFIPGRIRVRSPQVKGNPRFAEEARQNLLTIEGMKEVICSPRTGSVILHYDPQVLQPIDLLQAALMLGPLPENFDFAQLAELFSTTSASDVTRKLAGGDLTGQMAAGWNAIDRQVRKFTDNGADLRILVPISFFALGTQSLLRAKQVVFPSWYEYFWYGVSLFGLLYRPRESRPPIDA